MGALGALGGAMQKKPGAFDPNKYGLGGLYGDTAEQQGIAGDFMGHLRKVGSGQEQGISQGELGQMTRQGKGMIQQQAQTDLARLGEAALATGQGGRSGALGQNIASVNRNALNATRGLGGDALNYALQQRGADRDRAVRAGQTGLAALGQERGLQAQLAKLQYFGVPTGTGSYIGGQFQRDQFSRGRNILGGFMSGFSSGLGGGMGGMRTG
jgi:hypothetical protein